MATSPLSELLQRKKECYEAEAKKNKEIVDEWAVAVDKLFTQLRTWLAASDPTRILQIEERKEEVNEPNVGRYEVPRLEIRAFGKWVGIIPKARKTIRTARPPQSGAPDRATGRVDITDEVRRYVLYRFAGDGEAAWSVQAPDSDVLQPLTQELFEEALMSYLQ